MSQGRGCLTDTRPTTSPAPAQATPPERSPRPWKSEAGVDPASHLRAWMSGLEQAAVNQQPGSGTSIGSKNRSEVSINELEMGLPAEKYREEQEEVDQYAEGGTSVLNATKSRWLSLTVPWAWFEYLI